MQRTHPLCFTFHLSPLDIKDAQLFYIFSEIVNTIPQILNRTIASVLTQPLLCHLTWTGPCRHQVQCLDVLLVSTRRLWCGRGRRGAHLPSNQILSSYWDFSQCKRLLPGDFKCIMTFDVRWDRNGISQSEVEGWRGWGVLNCTYMFYTTVWCLKGDCWFYIWWNVYILIKVCNSSEPYTVCVARQNQIKSLFI